MFPLSSSARSGLSLASACFIMTSIGSGYAISAWNAQLKAHLGMDQRQIATVSSSLSFGLYWAIIPGFFFDRYGVRRTIVVGTILLPLLYACLSGLTAAKAAPMLLAVMLGFIGLSSQFAGIVCLGANEGLYGERNRGKVLGLLLSCFSAGGAVFSFVYKTFFNDHVAEYFSFMSLEGLIVCGLGVIFLANKAKDEHEYDALPDAHGHAVDNITGWALTKDSRFWHLFIAVLVGVGTGLFVMANLAFIYESAGGTADRVAPYVSLFSIGNLCGRLIVGYLSDKYLRVLPRAAFLAIGIAMTIVSEVLFLVTPVGWFVVPVALGGVAEGFLFPTYTVLTRELFGSRYFGENFGAITLANAIGFPLVLGPLASHLYHRQATHNPLTGADQCIGSSCFLGIFTIAMGLNCVGIYCAYQLVKAARR
ncbi:Major Facilitator Superfamily (MFS) [Achlya hypogyna]|uniref:Major Facilitator Superfamily (MFS) n=1 Tax=Achlya hypogyna TaxID=1202772 RepID=A0A1V9YC83_ACHHY|nr:Major Facilitator Superfamily (MFS) [Achlya hypogyna]